MRIDSSTLHLALVRLLTGPLRYTQDYSPAVLRVSWRRTGLRAPDLEQVLKIFVRKGLLRHYQAEGGVRYQLTVNGSVELYVEHGSWWQRWQDGWMLERLRRRRSLGGGGARPQTRLRRREDRLSSGGQSQAAPGDQPGEQRQGGGH